MVHQFRVLLSSAGSQVCLLQLNSSRCNMKHALSYENDEGKQKLLQPQRSSQALKHVKATIE